MKQVNETELKELINEGTVVVQFSAGWCGPCKTMTKLIDDNEGRFVHPVVKVDVDTNRAAAQAFSIRSLPTFVRVENREEAKRLVGSQNIDDLLKLAE